MTRGRRSANSRRQSRNGRSGVGISDVRARTDWQIGGGVVTPAAGAPVASSSWGGPITLAAGGIANIQAVTIPEAVTSAASPPAIGEIQVDEVQGSVFFTLAASGFNCLGVGMFISKFNTNTGAWVIRAASVNTEAMDDDWLFLRMLIVTVPTTNNEYVSIEVPLMLPHPIVLGRGEALHVAIDTGAGTGLTSAGVIVCWPFLRSRVSNIS